MAAPQQSENVSAAAAATPSWLWSVERTNDSGCGGGGSVGGGTEHGTRLKIARTRHTHTRGQKGGWRPRATCSSPPTDRPQETHQGGEEDEFQLMSRYSKTGLLLLYHQESLPSKISLSIVWWWGDEMGRVDTCLGWARLQGTFMMEISATPP